MADDDNHGGGGGAPSRPTISLPPRSFSQGAFTDRSPGPMTLVSSFFSENDPDSECRSFSQLLAGAMGSPVAAVMTTKKLSSNKDDDQQLKHNKSHGNDGGALNDDFRFESASFAAAAAQSHMFTVPPGLSPTSLFESPRFFSPVQRPFGMSHQQALAQVTAQAVQSQSQYHMPSDYSSSMLAPTETSLDPQASYGQYPLQMVDPRNNMVESSIVSYSEQKSQPPPLNVDKPADDGYNWRKYGQKQVKGSEYPRSYYKCTHPKCPVKKKVERSLEGHVTEIIYKGQHSHEPPQHIKRAKDGGNSNGKAHLPRYPEMGRPDHGGNLGISNESAGAVSKSKRDHESNQTTPEQVSCSSDGEEIGDAEIREDNGDNIDQPDPKRRNREARLYAPDSSHRAVTEPRIIVQTTSEVDLLDDGYRWRKYGQKVVKGNPHPRSYYKCTTVGCNVRKHVERASTDPKAVITTYEGKHTHDVPMGRHNSHNTANTYVSQMKPQNAQVEKHDLVNKMEFGVNNQQAASHLRFKEEHVT